MTHRDDPSDTLPNTSKPAQRALETIGITTLTQLSQKTRSEIAHLHGMGPKVLAILEAALTNKGLSFKGEK